MLRELSSDLPGFTPAHFAPGLNIAVADTDGAPAPPPWSPVERPVIPGRRQEPGVGLAAITPGRGEARGRHRTADGGATVGYTPLGELWARGRAAEAQAATAREPVEEDVPDVEAEPDGRHAAQMSDLVQVLDLMLGGAVSGRGPGRRQDLAHASSTLRMTVTGDLVTASRRGTAHGEVTVHSGSAGVDPWPIRLAEWQRWLGSTLFGLGGGHDEPTYRSLVSYFVRDADHGGFVDPIRNHAKQPAVETLPPLAHLFGLDPGLVEAAKTLHTSRKALRAQQRHDDDLPPGQRTSDAAAGRELARLTAEIATLELERAEAGAAASWRTARAASSGLAADPYLQTAALDRKLAELRARRDAIGRYADAHAELQRQALELRDSVRSDLRGRHDRLTAASARYTRYAYDLFGASRPAALTVAARDNGYAFYPVLGGDPEPGIRQLMLFCFDLAMAVTAHRAGTGPDFLVHDGALYDRMSGEQAAGALDLASRVCAVEDIQYVAVLSADKLHRVRACDPALSYHDCTAVAEA